MPTRTRTKPRSPRSTWSRYELQKLVSLVSLYRYDRINYAEVARHLWNKSAVDVKKRWGVVRDNARRQLRKVRPQRRERADTASVYRGELHE